MCGIFGIVLGTQTRFTPPILKTAVTRLLRLAYSRGKEAAGVAVLANGTLSVFKRPLQAKALARDRAYHAFLDDVIDPLAPGGRRAAVDRPVCVIGHARLATNGPPEDHHNNSPVVAGDVVGVHNGIIVNDGRLLEAFPSVTRKGVTDSEVLFGLLDHFIRAGRGPMTAVRELFRLIEGSANIAALTAGHPLMALASNTGSLFTCRNEPGNVLVFASESHMLRKALRKRRFARAAGPHRLAQIKPGRGCLVGLADGAVQWFDLNGGTGGPDPSAVGPSSRAVFRVVDRSFDPGLLGAAGRPDGG